MNYAVRSTACALLPFMLAACGGTRVIKDPEPLAIRQPLAESRGEHIDVFFEGIIVSGGPGSWSRGAKWDEYLLRVDNHHGDPLTIMWVRAFDSKTTEVRPADDRELLVKGSRETARRYRKEGVRVTAGVGSAPLVVAGGVAAVSAPYLTLGALSSGSATAAGAATAAAVAAPILLAGGALVAVNNRKVDKEIQKRRTTLPKRAEPGQPVHLDLFFPLVPSPQRVDVNYRLDGVSYTVSIELAEVFAGLHIVEQ